MYTRSFCLSVSSDLRSPSQIYAQPGDMIYGQANRCSNIEEMDREKMCQAGLFFQLC